MNFLVCETPRMVEEQDVLQKHPVHDGHVSHSSHRGQTVYDPLLVEFLPSYCS